MRSDEVFYVANDPETDSVGIGQTRRQAIRLVRRAAQAGGDFVASSISEDEESIFPDLDKDVNKFQPPTQFQTMVDGVVGVWDKFQYKTQGEV